MGLRGPKKGGPQVGGRAKGTPNKLTASVKQAFQEAFERLQNDEEANLDTWGRNNPTEFYKLASKLIPVDVKADVKADVNATVVELSETERKARLEALLSKARSAATTSAERATDEPESE